MLDGMELWLRKAGGRLLTPRGSRALRNPVVKTSQG
jgi:hypothetical protein